MTVVAEEAKESNVSEFPNRLASPEFFYLLQRIDGVGEKLTGEIKALAGEMKGLEEKLSAKIKAVEEKLSGEMKGLEEKLSGEIKASDEKSSKRMERFEEELRQNRRSSTAILWTGIFGFLVVIVAILFGTKVL